MDGYDLEVFSLISKHKDLQSPIDLHIFKMQHYKSIYSEAALMETSSGIDKSINSGILQT